MDLPDIQEQIDYANAVLGIQSQQAAEDRALAQEEAVTNQVIAERQAAQPPVQQNNNDKKRSK
jgi:hypothetical protein